MGQAYLAIVDPSGLRALLPEDEHGVKLYQCVRPALQNSAGFWTVLARDSVESLTDLLDQGDSQNALRVLCSETLDAGPVIPERPSA